MKLYRTDKARAGIWTTYDLLLEAWGVDVTNTDVPTRYGTTRVNVSGTEGAPPLILFHGVGDNSAMMWLYNAAALAPHFRLYAVDTLGGPGKSVPNANYNREFDIGMWIDDVLDNLRLERVYIAGVSHGGYLAQLYTLTRPGRVLKAVAMASSVPAGGGSAMKTMLRIFLPEALFPTKRNVKRLLVKLSGDNSRAFTGNPLLLEHFSHLLRGFNNMAMGHHRVQPFTAGQIGEIRGKMLYLLGNDDPFARLGGKEALERNRMHAVYFDGVGHGINHEIPGRVHELLIRHLTDNDTANNEESV